MVRERQAMRNRQELQHTISNKRMANTSMQGKLTAQAYKLDNIVEGTRSSDCPHAQSNWNLLIETKPDSVYTVYHACGHHTYLMLMINCF